MRKRFSSIKNRFAGVIDRRPLASFFGLLILLIVLIVVGNILRKPPVNNAVEEKEPKEVEILNIGNSPTVNMQGKVQNSGSIKIASLAAGIISKISKTAGQEVNKGERILTIGSNYQGANASSVSRQIAQKNYQATLDTFNLQKEILGKRYEIAQATDSQANDLREIARQSINETQNSINLNDSMLTTLNQQLANLKETNINGSNDALILQTQQAVSGVQNAVHSLRQALRQSDYQASDAQEPATLSRLSREITIKQLEIEQRSLQLTKEVAALNVQLATIAESATIPTSPCKGIIERIYPRQFDSVAPGQTLASISCSTSATSVIVLVSTDIAQNLNYLENATVYIGEDAVEAIPMAVASQPTDNGLHAITLSLTHDKAASLVHDSFVAVDLPIGAQTTSAAIPFIPIDAVYQTQTDAFVYVTKQENEKTVVDSRKIQIGSVYGSFVEVLGGLRENDQVIINRNVIVGDSVKVK